MAISSGVMGHWGATDATAGYAQARGVTNGARPLVLLSGLQLVLAGVFITFVYFVTVGDDGPFQIPGSLFDL